MRFEDLPLNDDILDALYDMRFDNCTPIQEKAIPPILEGHDVIGVAQTGTGKTASFLLPVLQKISEEEWDKNVINCLIMSPTRELAMQIDQQLEGFAYYTDIDSVAVYGGNDGVEFARQKKGLKTGADIVIATPGRLISHMNIGNVDLSKVSVLILDEADRMLDMGFFDDIMKIVAELPKERQTVMFSATMPPKIKKLADNILHNPVNVSIAVSRPADKIKQSSYVCYEREKQGILNNLLKEINSERTLIFASSKLKVKELARTLRSAHKNVGEMHSDLDQDKREDVMLGFKSGRISLLVATDIVARGIDVDDIRTVINYDVPHDAEDYVHRIGRTARAGAPPQIVGQTSGNRKGKRGPKARNVKDNCSQTSTAKQRWERNLFCAQEKQIQRQRKTQAPAQGSSEAATEVKLAAGNLSGQATTFSPTVEIISIDIKKIRQKVVGSLKKTIPTITAPTAHSGYTVCQSAVSQQPLPSETYSGQVLRGILPTTMQARCLKLCVSCRGRR